MIVLSPILIIGLALCAVFLFGKHSRRNMIFIVVAVGIAVGLHVIHS